MTDQVKRHSFTMNDFVHVSAEQFACIAQQTVLYRKLNVIRSLNVADQSKLMSSPMTHDIFRGKWPELQAAEMEKRKKKAEKEKEEKAKQAAAAKQPCWNKKPKVSNSRKDSGYSSNQQQQKRQPQGQEERWWWTLEMTYNTGSLLYR